MATLSFRPAVPSDVPSLLALIRSAYRGESSRAGWTTEADLLDDERIDAEGLLKKITKPDGVVLVVTSQPESNGEGELVEGTLTACCELEHKKSSNAAYFGMFAVVPTKQGGGIGRQVMGYAEAHAKKEWGVSKMEMWVIWLRADIIAWYERKGYKKTDRREPFPYAELVNGKALRDDLYFLVMEKELGVEA